MAINTQKFLPGSGSAPKALPQSNVAIVKVTPSDKKNFNTIRVKTVQVDKLLKGTLAADKKELDDKKRLASQKRKDDNEEKLEAQKEGDVKKGKMPIKGPKLGFLGWITNYIGNVLMGFFAVRLLKHLPKLQGILTALMGVGEFILNVGGFLLNGLVTFVDWGYKAYDATRGFIKSVGGDLFVRKFDAFIGVVTTLIDVLAVAAILKATRGDDWGWNRRGKRGRGVTKGRGGKAPGFRIPGTGPKVTRGRGTPKTGPKPKVTGGPKPKVTGVSQPKVTGGSQPKLPGGKPKVKVPRLKGGKAGGIFGLIMLIPTLFEAGGLISQGHWKTATNIILSTGASMAAFSGTMAGFGAAALALTGVSLGLGSPAAIALLIAGMAASTAASMGAYTLTYNLLKKAGLRDDDAAPGYAKGGKVQAKRTISKGKIKKSKRKPVVIQTSPVQPGESIGGEKKFLGIFPNPFGDKGFSPEKYFQDRGNEFIKSDFFGPVIGLAVRALVGQKPTSEDFKNAAGGVFNLIAKGLNSGELQGNLVSAFAGGGIALSQQRKKERNLVGWVENELQASLDLPINDSVQNLSRSSASQAQEGPTPGSPGTPGAGGTVVTPGTAGGAVSASELYKEIGANAEQWDIFRNSVALIESGGSYAAMGGSGDHYDGRYQMGKAAKIDGSKVAGVEYPGHSSNPDAQVRAAYRANPALQETIFTGFTVANHRYLMGNATYKSSNIERKLQILGYAHNQGMGGAEDWITTGVVGSDGFGTKGTKYTDLIAANFKAKKSGGKLDLASGAIAVPHPVIDSNASQISASPGQFGLVDPTPGVIPGVSGSTGYASDSGLDIVGKTGDPIVSPVSGTLEYAETGHTSWKDDSNPGAPGYQPQHSFLISLSSPFQYGGKTIKYAYGTHLSSLSETVANKFGISIRAGQPLGAMGVANRVPHLHLGLLQNRRQSSESDWLSNVQVKDLLSARRSHAGTKLSNREQLLKILPGQSLLDENTSKSIGATNLARFNAASTPEGVRSIAQQIAGVSDYVYYEQPSEQITLMPIPIPAPPSAPPASSGETGGVSIRISGGHDPFESLEKI